MSFGVSPVNYSDSDSDSDSVNPATRDPGVHTGHIPEPVSLAPLQVKLSISGEGLQDHWSSGLLSDPIFS